MKLDDLIHHTGEWLKGEGPYSHIVISTRIRLARNVKTIPFPSRANKKSLQEVLDRVEAASQQDEFFKSSAMLRMADLDNVDRQFLVERHLMSYEHASNPEGKALLVCPEEILSIMVNEEDHLRIQVLQSGLNLDESWKIIDRVDNNLSRHLDYAFSSQWGYLTACPTNTGTAMRGSVMLHLPALVMTKQISKVLNAITKLSFSARGFYGEGTQARGNFYQISNQVSLGNGETDILQNINGLIRQVIEQEEQARQALILQNKAVLEDKVFRSLGLLKNAYIMSSQETIELLSMVRLGIDLGIVKDVSRAVVNELFITTQPAHLQKIEGKKLTAAARDTKRASLIRQKLGGE